MILLMTNRSDMTQRRSALYFNIHLQITEEDNVLEDGTLIDLCGATLLWRSASSMQRMPVCI